MTGISDAKRLAGAEKIVRICARVQAGEKVLVLTDTETLEVGELLAIAALKITDDTVLAVITPRRGHGDDPPAHVTAAMRQSDVVIMPLRFSMTHSSATKKARNHGARVLSMGDFNGRMLERGGIEADFPKLEKVVRRVADVLTQGRIAEVTCPGGTEIRMDISGRRGSAESSLAHDPGSIAAPPDVEANVSPVEGSAEGVLVVDGSIPHPALGVITDVITIRVKAGRITDIQGKAQARILRHLLSEMKDPHIYNIAELGIGLNPHSGISGSMMEDEGAYGTFHIGIGDNRAYGGTVRAKSHIDLVIKKPTIAIDGETIQKEGDLIFPME